ncbi:MAG: DNA methylase [Flavobacteriaceae bacterium]|nr:DNA methylase [Flavobacteriaceae bacterium]
MKQQVKISKVKGNPNNPRIIKNDKFKKLVKSIQEFPEMLKLRPIVVDEDMIVLGGNMRLKASKDAGLKEVWIEIAEGLTEEQKKEFIVKDNVGFGEWEWDMLANEWDSVQLAEWGLDVWQNEDDVKEEEVYTKNIEAPTYEPKNEKPKEEELYNEDKVKELIKKIGLSNIKKEEKDFLIKAAYRHTVFNYQSIADFYSHSNKELQELMEDSALVIIDFNKAIENGYVILNKKLQDVYNSEYE